MASARAARPLTRGLPVGREALVCPPVHTASPTLMAALPPRTMPAKSMATDRRRCLPAPGRGRGRLLRTGRGLVLVALLLRTESALAAKTDVVVISNGDHFAGRGQVARPRPAEAQDRQRRGYLHRVGQDLRVRLGAVSSMSRRLRAVTSSARYAARGRTAGCTSSASGTHWNWASTRLFA